MQAPKSGWFSTVFSALRAPLIKILDRPSQAKYRGETSLKGLHHAVQVWFDRFGVPHVRAESEADLFFAQGYLHAQERLWQMDLNRRFLSGRMAELFGDSTLPWRELSSQFRDRQTSDLDFFMRILGVRQSAVESLSLLTEDDHHRLAAYTLGINRYIEICANKPPWEFRLLRHSPEPWTPTDSLTIAKGLAFLLSTALYTRLNLIPLAAKLQSDPAKLCSLLPDYPTDGPTITGDLVKQVSDLSHFTNTIIGTSPWQSTGHGSNNWVVGPTRAKSGKAILCNDPHLRMSLPSIFYLMRLEAGAAFDDYAAWGATIPGLPYVQLGQNRCIAWGVTAALCDDVELYRERLHRIDREQYMAGQEWRQFAERRELIRIRGARSSERRVRLSRHGPVISDFLNRDSGQEVLALRWCASEASRESHSLYQLNRAQNWQQFRAALSEHSTPSLNFVYADCRGNIGYTLAGRIPRRAAAPSLFPLPGWDDKNEWLGYLPFDELPHLYNPPSGAIATANNKIADAAYPHYLSNFFEPPQRIRRINQLLASQEQFSANDMCRLQLDQLSLHAVELVETLRDDLQAIQAANANDAEALTQLLTWDGSCTATSVPAAIFHVWHQKLLQLLLSAELGEELFRSYGEILNQCIVPTDTILADADSCWFTKRSRKSLVAQAFIAACDDLRQTVGRDCRRWQWGKIHSLTINHAFSRVAWLRPLLSLGPMPAGGDGMTINFGFYRHSTPYSQTVGPALRYVIDFNDPKSSGYVLASGQSGHPGSPHYGDQTVVWLSGAKIQLAAHDNQPGNDCFILKPC